MHRGVIWTQTTLQEQKHKGSAIRCDPPQTDRDWANKVIEAWRKQDAGSCYTLRRL